MVKNNVLILAGGIGSRMNSPTPKQFLEVCGKPIIVHTILNFQKNDAIDEIGVVCTEDWIGHLENLVEKFNLSKVSWIIPGGNSAHNSIKYGLYNFKNSMGADDFIVIHDAARPILPQAAIRVLLEKAHLHGNASLAIPCYETVVITKDGISGNSQIDRSSIMRVQTPQAYRYSLITELYERADIDGLDDFVYANLVAIHYGCRIYFARGFVNNLKITRPEDIVLFEALLNFDENLLYDPQL